MSRNNLKKVEEIEKKYTKIIDYILKYDKISKIKSLDEYEQIIYRCCTNNSLPGD